MSTRYRIVGWCVDRDGVKSVRSVHEFGTTLTRSGTHRKIGRSIFRMLEAVSVDHVVVEKRIQPSETSGSMYKGA